MKRHFITLIVLIPFVYFLTKEKQVPVKPMDISEAQHPFFLFISDIHLDSLSEKTPQKGRHDTGRDLWKNFLAKADSVLSGKNAPDFIVYTGDLPAHYGPSYIPPGQRYERNTNMHMILDGLRQLATKFHKPFFYIPGNNDGLAGDYYSFADAQEQTPFSLVPDSKNPYPALNINPSPAAPCIISNPDSLKGYYSARPVNGLRLVALNTVMFSHEFHVDDHTSIDSDRAEQMKWLGGQLADAAAKGEKVYIAMHIPPGIDAYNSQYGQTVMMWDTAGNNMLLNNFLRLVNQYQATIAGILYGHTHMDEVRRLYDSTGTKITEVAISCPGVTPYNGNRPGFKLVQYDSQNMELMDFTTYYTTAGLSFWGPNSYTFHDTYQCPANTSIFQRLSAMPLSNVSNDMAPVYQVKNGYPKSFFSKGIEVKWAQ